MSNILTTKNPYRNHWYDFVKEVINDENDSDMKTRRYARIAEYLEENPDEFGSVILIDSLIEYVNDKCILDYDGCGRYISFTDFSKKECRSVEDIKDLKKHRNEYFFVWYNK